jgi:hypothetical protein
MAAVLEKEGGMKSYRVEPVADSDILRYAKYMVLDERENLICIHYDKQSAELCARTKNANAVRSSRKRKE